MTILRIISTIIAYLIKGIRPFLGPPGCCKYRPTCTQFAQQQLENNALHRALWNIIIRLLSCNPFTR